MDKEDIADAVPETTMVSTYVEIKNYLRLEKQVKIASTLTQKSYLRY